MLDPVAIKPEQKKDWTLNQRAFDRLLVWLDDGTESGGRSYLEMRQRLVSYFDRKNCAMPDELADETLSRVARRVDEEGTIESESTARYCYIVARFVFLEHLRNTEKSTALQDDLRRDQVQQDTDTEGQLEQERRLACLDRCVAELTPVNRELIVGYYVGGGRVKIDNRRVWAEKLGISVNALAIRACRLRDKLEQCVRQCLGNPAK
jgi:DNA-directed RNA polymerase specialized sigma24 family protein